MFILHSNSDFSCDTFVNVSYLLVYTRPNDIGQYKRQWVSNNLVLSVVKDVPRPWFLASLPWSVWFMCCVNDLYNYVPRMYLYCLFHMNHNPQQWTIVHNCGPQWTKVHKCGPKSTNVDQMTLTLPIYAKGQIALALPIYAKDQIALALPSYIKVQIALALTVYTEVILDAIF